jgi:hypothetical protein
MSHINIEDITCPITGQIFRNPVIAYDGIIYERDAIVEWFKRSYTSPIRNNVTVKSTNVYPVQLMKNMVDGYLKLHPQSEVYEKTSFDYNELMGILNQDINRILKFNHLLITQLICSMPGLLEHSIKMGIFLNDIVIRHIIDTLNTPNILLAESEPLINIMCKHSSCDMIKYLVTDKKFPIKCNVEMYDSLGHTGLFIACKNNRLDVVQLLLSVGANPNAKNRTSCTPVHVATEYGTTDMLECLFNAGGLIDAETMNYMKPIHLACKKNDLNLVKYLVSKGASLLIEPQEEKYVAVASGWDDPRLRCANPI